MKRKMILLSVLTTLLISGCSDKSSSNTLIENMSEANEINGIITDETLALPDSVSFDSDRSTELIPDGSGNITCKEMGVTSPLPSQYKAYFYSIGDVSGDEWTKNVNSSCTHSLFIVSPYYPQVSEYIRISVDRLIAPQVIPYDVIKKSDKDLTKAEYLRRVKNDIEYNAATFIAFENADMYNYIGASGQDGYAAEAVSNSKVNYDTVAVSSLRVPREAAPDSSISEIKYNPVELTNGNFGLRLDYTLKRNGIETAKEVYWLYSEGQLTMRRIEFTKDISSGTSVDTDAFLESIEFFTPQVPENNLLYGVEQIWAQEAEQN